MKFIYTILLVLLVFSCFSQQTQGISLDDEATEEVSTSTTNYDSLQNYEKELVTGAYVLGDKEWFTKDTIHLTEKLNYIKTHRSTFEYFFFNRNGKVEVNTYVPDNAIKFLKDVTINYGTWFFDKDKLNVVLNGFSNTYGKFEYRIAYDFIKSGTNIILITHERKLSNTEKSQY